MAQVSKTKVKIYNEFPHLLVVLNLDLHGVKPRPSPHAYMPNNVHSYINICGMLRSSNLMVSLLLLVSSWIIQFIYPLLRCCFRLAYCTQQGFITIVLLSSLWKSSKSMEMLAYNLVVWPSPSQYKRNIDNVLLFLYNVLYYLHYQFC